MLAIAASVVVARLKEELNLSNILLSKSIVGSHTMFSLLQAWLNKHTAFLSP
jgi:hypothetical protein